MINLLLNWNEFWNNLGEFFSSYGRKLYEFWINPTEGTPYIITLVFALAFLVLGYFLIKLINKGIRKLFKIGKKKFENEKTIKNFAANLINVVLNVLLVLAFLSILGISLNGIATIFSSAILAIGLSLQDIIGNFASGLIILTTRPFITGDYVSINSECEGEVTDVKLLATYLLTYDKQIVVVPNKTITNSIITNYSSHHLRRVVISVGVDYNSDIDKVKTVMLSLTNGDKKIDQDVSPSVVLSSMGEYSLNFSLRFYVRTEDYWDVLFSYNEKIIKSFQENKINIPFKRIDIGHATKEIIKIEN